MAEPSSFSVPARVVSGDVSLRALYSLAWEQRQVVLRLVSVLTYLWGMAARTGEIVSFWRGLVRGVSGPVSIALSDERLRLVGISMLRRWSPEGKRAREERRSLEIYMVCWRVRCGRLVWV